jgi:UV DNA damage endonuclease
LTGEAVPLEDVKTPMKTPAKKATPGKRAAAKPTKKKAAAKSVPTPLASDEEDDQLSTPPLSDVGTEDEAPAVQKRNARATATRKKSGRATAQVSYKEEADEMSM